MRSPFRSFHSLILACIGTLAYQLLRWSPDWAQEPQYGAYVQPAILLVLWWLFSFSRTISDKVLEWLPPVRRFFARRKHIEGDWPLVVVDGQSGVLVYYGFLAIGFEDGQYAVKGTDWYPDGRHALNFQSMQSYQLHPTLHYWYTQGERGRQRGYTFIEFFPEDDVPTRHTGVFHDKEHPNVRFYARKIEYRWFQRRIKGMEPRRCAAEKFKDEIMPKVPTMIRTTVDVDWD